MKKRSPRKGRQVNIIPDAPPGVEPIMGTLKTLFGCEVIEVHSGFYKSPDLRYSAFRESRSEGASFTGWVVRDDTYLDTYSDPINRKEDAIHEMARWAGRSCRSRRPSHTSRPRRNPPVSIEEVASAPVGTLLVTQDGFEAWRKVQPGKSGWLQQKPSGHSLDGWVGAEGPLVGWQGRGFRAWMRIVKLVAAKELYEIKAPKLSNPRLKYG